MDEQVICNGKVDPDIGGHVGASTGSPGPFSTAVIAKSPNTPSVPDMSTSSVGSTTGPATDPVTLDSVSTVYVEGSGTISHVPGGTKNDRM